MARAHRPRTRPGLGVRGAIVLVVALAAIAAWIVANRRVVGEGAEPASASILEHVPPGAMLLATVDVAALRGTPLGEQLLGQGRTVAGLGEVTAICGADPMDAVRLLAIAIPDAGQDTGFGLFAAGPFDAAELIGCAEKIVAGRGGRPVRSPAGRFLLLKDASLELSSAELAAADGGPVILGEPAYVRAALGTESAESSERDERHAALRGLVPGGQLVATAALSAEQRRALISELKAQNMPDSPFRSVNGAALSVSVTDEIALSVAVRCDDAEASLRVAEHIRRAAESEADSLPAQAIGLSALLERLDVKADAQAVHVRLSMPAAEALATLRRALALRKLAEPGVFPEAPVEPAPDAGAGGAGIRIEARPPPPGAGSGQPPELP